MNFLKKLFGRKNIESQEVDQSDIIKKPSFHGIDLLDAAYNGDVSLVKKILSEGIDVDYIHRSNPKGETALMYAAEEGQIEVIKTLLAAGADVNHRGLGSNRTPLEIATSCGQQKAVEILLNNGKEIEAQDENASSDNAHNGDKPIEDTLIPGKVKRVIIVSKMDAEETNVSKFLESLTPHMSLSYAKDIDHENCKLTWIKADPNECTESMLIETAYETWEDLKGNPEYTMKVYFFEQTIFGPKAVLVARKLEKKKEETNEFRYPLEFSKKTGRLNSSFGIFIV